MGTMGNVVHLDPIGLYPTTAVHQERCFFGQCHVHSPEFFQQWWSLLNIPRGGPMAGRSVSCVHVYRPAADVLGFSFLNASLRGQCIVFDVRIKKRKKKRKR